MYWAVGPLVTQPYSWDIAREGEKAGRKGRRGERGREGEEGRVGILGSLYLVIRHNERSIKFLKVNQTNYACGKVSSCVLKLMPHCRTCRCIEIYIPVMQLLHMLCSVCVGGGGVWGVDGWGGGQCDLRCYVNSEIHHWKHSMLFKIVYIQSFLL